MRAARRPGRSGSQQLAFVGLQCTTEPLIISISGRDQHLDDEVGDLGDPRLHPPAFLYLGLELGYALAKPGPGLHEIADLGLEMRYSTGQSGNLGDRAHRGGSDPLYTGATPGAESTCYSDHDATNRHTCGSSLSYGAIP